MPEVSAVAVALTGPERVSSVPMPADAGFTVPEIVQLVWVATNAGTIWLAPLIVTLRETGVKVKPGLPGVMV